VAANGQLLFVTAADNAGLWASDGTVAGTVRIKPLVGEFESDLFAFRPFAGGAYFLARSSLAAGEMAVWKTDGSEAGTSMVAPLGTVTGPGAYVLGGTIWSEAGATVGNTAYFSAADAEHGLELWQTDGRGNAIDRGPDAGPWEFGHWCGRGGGRRALRHNANLFARRSRFVGGAAAANWPDRERRGLER
jgi:ELWxxDGT repeat protein